MQNQSITNSAKSCVSENSINYLLSKSLNAHIDQRLRECENEMK
jgi:hypothetical protein